MANTLDYAKAITQVRAKLNLSQESLGKKIGVSFSTVNRWENNKAFPSRKHLCALENLCSENNMVFEEKEEKK